jgi:hypothetical protein
MTDIKPSFYEAVKHIKHDHHESDLYLLWTSESAELVKQYSKNAKVFRSELDGELYFDVPFAYEPFWTAKQR